MNRWLTNLPSNQVVYFGTCEILYRALIALSVLTEPVGRHFDILAGYAFKSSDYTPAGIRLLRNINVKPDHIDWSDAAYISPDNAQEFDRFRLFTGDLVLSMDGTVNKQGIKIAFLTNQDVPSLLLQRVCRFNPIGSVDDRFLYHVLHSTDFLDHIDESNRSIAIPHVSPGQLMSFQIPIPTPDLERPICDFLDAVRLGIPSELWPELPAVLAPQRRLATQLKQLTDQLDEMCRLREQQELEIRQMLRAAFHRIASVAPRRPMREVAPLVRRPVEVKADRLYSELGIRSFGKGTFHKPALSHIELGTKRIFWIQPGDLLFSNVFSWEGAIAVAKNDDVGRVGSHRFMSCVPKPGLINAEFLRYFFLTPEGLDLIGIASPGGAGRNRTLGLAALSEIEVPVPPIEHQQWFDEIQAEVDAIDRLRAEASAELDALLPSILDKAFNGEL